MARNITYVTALTDEAIINQFFDNLEPNLERAPPFNIWNNLVDDPSSKKVITKRGTKYQEQIRN
jgi:hypothetical protein